jgi:PncC family amidohydrolase
MDEGLEIEVGERLQAKGWRACTAESCTGGLVAHRLTNIPGSSAYVLGGVVAYANAIKVALLGVQEATLAAHGAVSAQTAEEMALGALARFGADVAVSITGIAGPGGGSAEKPVGLTYIAAATRSGVFRVERHVWAGERIAVKEQSADAALRLMMAAIE